MRVNVLVHGYVCALVVRMRMLCLRNFITE